MERVVVVGCGGSGKTSVGRRLGLGLGVPVVHLDVVYYDADWNTLPREEFAAVQEELVAAPRWVIDGNYASTLPIRLGRATVVVFLDLGPWACLWGILRRRLAYGGGQDDATGVYDRIDWGFIRYVWTYRRRMAPRVRSMILEHGSHAEVYLVHSRRAANRLVDSLIARAGRPTGT